jgi:hypothetical protein
MKSIDIVEIDIERRAMFFVQPSMKLIELLLQDNKVRRLLFDAFL